MHLIFCKKFNLFRTIFSRKILIIFLQNLIKKSQEKDQIFQKEDQIFQRKDQIFQRAKIKPPKLNFIFPPQLTLLRSEASPPGPYTPSKPQNKTFKNPRPPSVTASLFQNSSSHHRHNSVSAPSLAFEAKQRAAAGADAYDRRI